MDLKDLLAISGYSGLFKHISQTKNGIIVESLIDKKRMPAYASSKISALDDIAIFTTGDDLPLASVFENIFKKEDGKETLSHKSSSTELKAYFKDVLPEYDDDRVYVSDIKKVIQWYNILVGLNMISLEEEKLEEEAVETEKNPDSKDEKLNA